MKTLGMDILIVVAIAIIMAIPVMLVWNAVVPNVTKDALTPINFCQALGISFLCNALFNNYAKGK